MRILLCDDDAAILNQVEAYLKEYFKKSGFSLPEIAKYTSGDGLVESGDIGEIAFLDVEMPGLSGIYVGERLKQRNPLVKIFILTSYMDYLDEAMKFRVFRYLSKPIDKARLFRNIKEAVYQIEVESEPITVETKDGVITCPADNIIFLEIERRKATIITTSNA